jgi:hypothetical protein
VSLTKGSRCRPGFGSSSSSSSCWPSLATLAADASQGSPLIYVARRGARKSAAAVASLENVPAGLDWEAFSAAYFPGQRRHDLQAISAYGTYRRSRVIDERSAQTAARLEEAEGTSAGTAAVDTWEDEGGSTL